MPRTGAGGPTPEPKAIEDRQAAFKLIGLNCDPIDEDALQNQMKYDVATRAEKRRPPRNADPMIHRSLRRRHARQGRGREDQALAKASGPTRRTSRRRTTTSCQGRSGPSGRRAKAARMRSAFKSAAARSGRRAAAATTTSATSKSPRSGRPGRPDPGKQKKAPVAIPALFCCLGVRLI